MVIAIPDDNCHVVLCSQTAILPALFHYGLIGRQIGSGAQVVISTEDFISLAKSMLAWKTYFPCKPSKKEFLNRE